MTKFKDLKFLFVGHSRSLLIGLLQYVFGNKYGSFSPKTVGRKKLSKSVFGYFKI